MATKKAPQKQGRDCSTTLNIRLCSSSITHIWDDDKRASCEGVLSLLHPVPSHTPDQQQPAEEGRAQPKPLFTSAELVATLRDLRMVRDEERRVDMIVQVVTRHGLGYPEVLAAARVAIEGSRCSSYKQREALAALVPIPAMPNPIYPAPVEPTVAAEREPAPAKAKPIPVASDQYMVEGDPELLRIAIGLGEAAACRLWLISRVLDARGVGHITKAALEAELPAFGVTHTRRYLNRLIRRGNGVFWAISADSKLIHLRSYEKVAIRLTERALRDKPALVTTNAPGQKFKTLTVAGSIADWEAQGLSVWLDSRRDQGMTNIAISTLCSLFGRTANTIRDWLLRAKIIRQYNYTQYAGSNEALIPAFASLYVTRDGSYKVSWQVSSSYHPKKTPERQHRRTPRHVYHMCQQLLEDGPPGHPAGDCGTALHGSEPCTESTVQGEESQQGGGVYRTGRLFFESSKGSLEARKRANRHVQWHQDSNVAHHVLLGFKRRPYPQQGRGPRRSHDIGVYECIDPEQRGMTGLHERSYKAPYQTRHRQQLAGYRDYLKG